MTHRPLLLFAALLAALALTPGPAAADAQNRAEVHGCSLVVLGRGVLGR